jgi:hypothetical protein
LHLEVSIFGKNFISIISTRDPVPFTVRSQGKEIDVRRTLFKLYKCNWHVMYKSCTVVRELSYLKDNFTGSKFAKQLIPRIQLPCYPVVLPG